MLWPIGRLQPALKYLLANEFLLFRPVVGYNCSHHRHYMVVAIPIPVLVGYIRIILGANHLPTHRLATTIVLMIVQNY